MATNYADDYTDEYIEAKRKQWAEQSNGNTPIVENEYTDDFIKAKRKQWADAEAQKQAEYEASRPINKIKNLVSDVANNLNQNVKSTQPPLINNQNQTLETPENQQSSLIKNTQSFAEKHPFVNSIPEASKQFALRAVKSYPTYAMGLNDLLAVIGDKTNNQNLSDFGKSNYEFWKEQSDKIPVDEKYQGLKGLSDKSTVLPTIAGSLGDQTTNIINALGGGSLGGSVAAKLGLNGLFKTGAITAGSSIPNIAQEGSYLDKIEAFEQIYGRKPTEEELKNIQNVSLTEKGINTALETAADRLLFNKLFPASVGKKNVQKILKDTLQQAATEAGTELGQETTSIGAEKILGINQDNNLQRLLDTLAISGITGGVTGGVSSAMSRQYDTQFPEAEKNVSAKIVNNGKVIYDSSNETAFDALKQLSKNGSLKNNTERLAENQQPQKQTFENLVNTENKTVEYPPALRDNNGFIITENNPLVATERPTQHQNKVEYYPAVYEQENNTNENIAENENISDNKEEVFDAGRYINQTAQTKQYGSVTREQMSAMKQYRASLKTDIENLKEPKSEYEYIKSKYNGKVYSHYIYNYGDEQQRANDEFNIIIEDIKIYARTNITSIPDNVIKLWEMQMESAYHVWYDGDTADQEVKYDKFYTALNKVWEYHICNEVIDNTTIKGKRNGNEQRTTKTVERNIPQEPEQIPDDIGNNTERRNEGMDNQGNDEKYETDGRTGVVETQQNANGITRNLPEINGEKQDTEQLRNVLKNDLGFEDTDKVVDTLLSDGKEKPDFSVAYVNTIRGRLREHDKNAYKQFCDLYENYLKKRKENKAAVLEKSPKIADNGNKEVIENGQRRTEVQETSGRIGSEIESSENNGRETSINGRSGLHNADGRGIHGQERGLTPEHKELIDRDYKTQNERNSAIEKFINDKEYEKYSELPQEIKEWLKTYSGAGGLEKQGATGKGLLSEYYTPKNIVKKMWDLTSQYINTDGSKVLEPSVGIGRFLEFAPENITVDAHEINPVSAKITELLYPNTNVSLGEFQKRFIKDNKPVSSVKPEYDIIIGNPPYGQNAGIYYGMGEGKGITRLENYFIKRGIDLLNENGILTFIVPSSFLDAKDASTSGVRLAVSQKAELLDAYRLPEKTFDSTSIGTDIIVMRKNSGEKTNRDWIQPGNWFEQHPEKILGEVKTRTNRFGKEEKYVSGDKNAADKIDTSNKDIREAKKAETKTPKTKGATEKKTQQTKEKTTEKTKEKKQDNSTPVEYEEYKIDNSAFTEKQLQTFYDTRVDGTLPKDKYEPNEYVNQYDGDLYNDFNYLQGDIYEKLEQLEHENISEKQKEIQRQKLEKVKPTPKTIDQMSLSPVTDFARDFETGLTEDKNHYGGGKWHNKGDKLSLPDMYLKYANDLTLPERDNMPISYIQNYINGEKLGIDYNYPPDCTSEKDKKLFREKESIRIKTQLINTVDRTFKNFVKDVLDADLKTKLINQWNRVNNNLYNPDYTKMPMLVKGLSANFYGDKLKLLPAQTEGVNFLTNKGTGLLGFEVGVGKTLTGAIATVQNMQMGRCKRPLVLVPKQVLENWIKEFKEAFPNIKINNVGNMADFKGTIKDNTVTVATYQALDNIWYDQKAEHDLLHFIADASINAKKNITQRNKEKTEEQAATVLGTAKAGNKEKFTLENLGIDHITVDEAHNFKNLFAKAQSYDDKNNMYNDIPGGSQSKRACQLFLATQYILQHNNNSNVFLLTATPFNNQPLEVYNMLSYTAKDILDKMGLNNVYQFMETYADIVSDFVVDSNNNVVYKQIVNGFKNVASLKSIIRSTMLIRTAEEAGVKRPEKTVKTVKLEPTDAQLEELAAAEKIAVTNKDDGDVLRAINQSRQATLSPDIAANNFDISPQDFVNNSPKLKYCCDAIETMLKKDRQTSQILYMPLGVKFLPKIKQYLVDKKVLNADEIKIVDSSIKDDQIEDIVKSFNDRNGKLKLIIGTSKIKEGMNLNKNTSTLYVPYLEWNPTDFQQVVGRLWRQGNSHKKVRIIVPLLKNSADSFMFQKLQEKSERLNALLSKEDVDFIDMQELNTAEDKINMISAPDKKAKMFVQIEEQKIRGEKASLEGRKETVLSYQNKLKEAEKDVKSYSECLEEAEKDLDKYSKLLAQETDENSYTYRSYKSSVETAKNKIKTYKDETKKTEKRLQTLQNRIKSLELDFDGRDSIENIDKLIAEKDEQIKNLKDIEDKKLVEYQKQYDKEREESKTIADYINEFEKESDKYIEREEENGQYSIDIPDSLQNEKNNPVDYNINYKDLNIEDINKLISKGCTQEELLNVLPQEIQQEFKNIHDYKFYNYNLSKKTKGIQYGGNIKTIYINLDVVGNNPKKLIDTLMHEVRHAQQDEYYDSLIEQKNIGYNLSANDLEYIKQYKKSKRLNSAIQKYLNKNKTIIDLIVNPFLDKNKNLSDIELNNELNKLKNVFNRRIIRKYLKYINKYLELFTEVDARRNGTFYSKDYKDEETVQRQRGSNGGNKGFQNALTYRNIGDKIRSQIHGGQDAKYSIEPIPKSTTGQISEDKANEKAKDAIRKWYSKIEKDRYDVNKTLNSLINITKIYAKDFLKKYKIKVSDKMVREVMPFLRERTGIPDNLNRPELIKFFNALTSADKTKLTKLADETSAKFDKYYQEYKDIKGSLSDSDIENHISHIWKKTEKDLPLLTNYFATSSKYAKNRTIPTIFDGINGITLENGEKKYYEPQTLDYAEILKMSSDTFIKANADIVLADLVKKIRGNDGELLVKPYSKAPSNWVEFDHPALAKRVFLGSNNDTITLDKQTVKVHPDIADTLKTVFETYRDSEFMQAYDTLNSAYKQAQLGFSGFHIVALTESMLGNMGIKKTANILKPARIFNEVKNGNWNIYKDDALAHQAIDDGLQFGATLDINRKTVEKIVDDAADKVGSKIPLLGKTLSVISKAQKLNNKILWDYLHNNYKLECYKALCEQEARKRKLTAKDRQEIAQWVNDSFGGQVWELLGISTTGRKTEQRIFLSPDWLRSTTRQFLGMFSNGKIQTLLKDKSEQSKFWKTAKEIGERWGVNSLTGDVESSSMRGRIARAFWLRSIIYSAIFYNVFNALMRLWDKEKNPQYYDKNLKLSDLLMYSNSAPTDNAFDKFLPKIFVGRNKDGSERMLRLGKQFREVPELVSNPIKKLGGKLSPNIQIASQILTGHTASGFKNKDMFEKDGTTRKNRITSGAKVIAKSFEPYSINQLFNENSEPSWFSLFAPVSKGMTQDKAKYEFMKIYQNGTPEQIAELEKIMAKNGIDKKTIKKIRKTARTEYKNTYKSEFIAALKADNKNKITEIELKMKKDGFNRSEIRKTLLKAKEDLKKKGK